MRLRPDTETKTEKYLWRSPAAGAFEGVSGGSASVSSSTSTSVQNLVLAQPHASDTVQHLIASCSQDTPALERMHAASYFGAAVLAVGSVAANFNDLAPIGLMCGSGIIGLTYSMRRALQRGYMKDAESYADLGPDAIPRLVDALVKENSRVEAVVSYVLAAILGTLTTNQFSDISYETRHTLFRWLSRPGPAFIHTRLGIIRTVSEIADEDFVPYLESLSRKPALTPNTRKVKRTARRALLQLVERIDSLEKLQVVGIATDKLAGSQIEDSETNEQSRAVLSQLRNHSKNRAAQPSIRMEYLLANWCCITPYVGYMGLQSILTRQSMIYSLLWIVGTALSTQLYRLALTPAHTRMARQLAEMGDASGVGALAEALEWPDPEIQSIARAALIRMLPRLTDNDVSYLNTQQRRCLNSKLVLSNAKSYLDAELQIKILQAWEKVGDSSSLQAVTGLVSAKAVLQNERKVQKAAIACLPLLEVIAAKNDSSVVLLRASAIPEAGLDQLVRPASSLEVPSAELVRPSEPEAPL